MEIFYKCNTLSIVVTKLIPRSDKSSDVMGLEFYCNQGIVAEKETLNIYILSCM